MLGLLGFRSAAERTEERRMCRHICALEHLRKTSECTNNVLDQLESRLCTLAEGLRKALRIVRVARHAHAAVHAAHSHSTHSTIHATITTAVHRAHTAETRIGRRVAVVATTIGAVRRGAVASVHVGICRCVPIRDCAERIWY